MQRALAACACTACAWRRVARQRGLACARCKQWLQRLVHGCSALLVVEHAQFAGQLAAQDGAGVSNVVSLAVGQKAASRPLDPGVWAVPQRLCRAGRPHKEVPPWRGVRCGLDASQERCVLVEPAQVEQVDVLVVCVGGGGA